MNILITGGSGFIGSNLAQGLAAKGHEVTAPSRSALDLLDADAVNDWAKARPNFDRVIHAATVRSNRLLGSPPDLFQQNVRMFLNVARAFGRIFWLSSGKVYGDTVCANVHENVFSIRVPQDDYGFSKYVCAVAAGALAFSCELRLFGVFGPGENWRVRFISNACCRAVFGLPIYIRRNRWMDYMDVQDLAEVLDSLMYRGVHHRAYNVCVGRAVPLTALATKVVAVSGKRLEIIVGEEGKAPEYSGDNSRLMGEFPWLRFADLSASIARLYHWYEEHKSSINPEELRLDEKEVAA